MIHLDCAIIGAGPAGLMAAIQASRLRLCFAVFERAKPGGQALAANWIENFPGFPDGISGRDLMQRFLKQVCSDGIEVRREEIIRLESEPNALKLTTNREELMARTVIVAAGLLPKKLKIPGEDKVAGRHLFAYTDPDSVPHDGKTVMIIGDGDAAFDQGLFYSRRALGVCIAMKHESPRCAVLLAERAKKAGITILPREIAKRLEEERGRVLITFECEGGEKETSADIVIACTGKEKKLDFIAPELMRDDAKGIFYAGDCSMGRMGHIAIAAGDGMRAAMDAAKYLQGTKIQIPMTNEFPNPNTQLGH